MATCMTVVSLISVRQDPNNRGYVNGSATYRTAKKTYKNFDFKFYNNQDNVDIQSFKEGDVVALTGKFSYRHDYKGDNPLFLSVNQAITFPKPKSGWNPEQLTIAHPYVTLTVYLNPNPLTKCLEHNVIKCLCSKVFCSYDNKKYDHTFHLYYEGVRWEKIIKSIEKGNMKVHISGFYLGYTPKESNTSFFQAIRLTELDFESKSSKYNDDDEEELIFGPISNKSKKHQISTSSPSEPAESSESSTSSEIFVEKKKKKQKKVKESTSSDNESTTTTITQSLSYDSLSTPANKAMEQLEKEDLSKNYPPYYPYYNPYFRPPPTSYHHPYPPYPPPPHNYYNPEPKNSSTESSTNITNLQQQNTSKINEEGKANTKKTKTKSVKFEDSNDNNPTELSEKGKKPRGRKGSRGGARNTATTSTRILRNSKKKGIMDIAVEKVAETSEDETMHTSDDQKRESFMDTEEE